MHDECKLIVLATVLDQGTEREKELDPAGLKRDAFPHEE